MGLYLSLATVSSADHRGTACANLLGLLSPTSELLTGPVSQSGYGFVRRPPRYGMRKPFRFA
jgi:hypothetical protein